MPNGRPGDHPYTDIVRHGIDVHDAEVSKIVRHVAEVDEANASHRASRLLWEAGGSPPDERLVQLKQDLYSLAAELRVGENYAHASPLEACLEDDEAVYTGSVRELVREMHQEIEDVENDWLVRPKLEAILWEFGWETDRLDELKARLEVFRERTVREQ